MKFSEFQLDQIKRFAAASESLHQSPILLSAPGMAKAALGAAMKTEKIRNVPNETLDAAIDTFTQLSSYSAIAKRVTKLMLLLLAIAIGYGAYLWQQVGALIGIAVLIGIVIVLFVGTSFYGYLAIRPIKQQFHLIDEEVTFALNDIIADPRWQADL